MKQKEVFYFEVGVKCDNDNEEGRRINNFRFNFNIIDENKGETKNITEAVNYVDDYVKFGVNGTYGVVVKVLVTKEEYESIYNGFSELFDYNNLSTGELVLAEYLENGKVITIYKNYK